jgi:hypothetical protein
MDDLILYLITAILYGYIECYVMENGFAIGQMDFLGFKLKYHGPMLLLALTIGYAAGVMWAIVWWALVEDLAFWGSSKWFLSYKYKLTADSWIAKKMGSITQGRVMIPVVYVVMLAAGWVLSWGNL